MPPSTPATNAVDKDASPRVSQTSLTLRRKRTELLCADENRDSSPRAGAQTDPWVELRVSSASRSRNGVLNPAIRVIAFREKEQFRTEGRKVVFPGKHAGANGEFRIRAANRVF